MNRTVGLGLVVVLLAGCWSEPQPRKVQPTPPEAQPVTITPPPRPTIDPKSSEAAEELVRGFVRLLNEGKIADAYMLLGPNAPPRAEFESGWKSYSNLRVTSGAAGAQDGAAGSIYVSVPLTITGKVQGKDVRRSATVVVRRINDVPGSTEAQRRWHIDRIDYAK